MKKFRGRYHNRSLRASWWNYAANGLYFITICTAHRDRLFCRVVSSSAFPLSLQLQLTPIREIVHNEWEKSFQIRQELYCDAFVIMPDHIHAVLRIANPMMEGTHGHQMIDPHGHPKIGTHGRAYRQPKSISSFVAGFKSSATKRVNEYRGTPRKPVWQSRFHDRIIRNRGNIKIV